MTDRDLALLRSVALSRRAFLERAGLLTGGLVVLGPGGWLNAGRASAQLEKALPIDKAMATRPFASAAYSLVLNGATVGNVQSVEGGIARGEVIEQVAGGLASKKNIGALRFEPIRLRAPIAGMAPPFWELVSGAIEGQPMRVDGAIVTADFRGNASSQMSFQQAFVSQVTIPGPDASSKEPALLEVVLNPESTRTEKASGPGKAHFDKQPKKALLSQFRLSIDGLDDACKRVNKVEALVIKQKVSEDSIGEAREFQKQPGKLEIPNLVFTFSAADADKWQDYHKHFLIGGNNGDDQEKDGTLEFLAPNAQDVLLTVKLSRLGLFALSRVASEGEAVARMKAEMYCEGIGVELPKAPA